jgi:hypothetical protein
MYNERWCRIVRPIDIAGEGGVVMRNVRNGNDQWRDYRARDRHELMLDSVGLQQPAFANFGIEAFVPSHAGRAARTLNERSPWFEDDNGISERRDGDRNLGLISPLAPFDLLPVPLLRFIPG